MSPSSVYFSIRPEMREVLSSVASRPCTFRECRRAALVANCDLRASAFRDVFFEAVEVGFLASAGGDRFRLTVKGTSVLESAECRPLLRVPAIKTRNANESSVLRGQGFERELIFGEQDVAGAPICLERVTLRTGEECVPHAHLGADTVVYTLRGKVRVYYGSELEHSVEVGPEDCVHIPPGVIHYVVNEEHEPMTAIVARTRARHQVREYPRLRSCVPSMAG